MQSRHTADLAILLVDDERQTLKYFERAFAKDFTVLTAPSADEAEAIVDASPGRIGVIISDQRMPGRTGVSLLNAVRRKHPAIVRMLTTAYSELDDAIEAVNRGEIFRYIVKPWDFDLLRQEINTGLLVYALQAERDLLIGEKLIARQRMQAVDRTRDLAVIAASLPGLRHGKLAVDDYVRDSAANFASAPTVTDTVGLDLWSVPQAETRHMSAVAAEAVRIAGQLQPAAGSPASLAECVRGALAVAAPLAAAGNVKVVEAASAAVDISAPAPLVRDAVAAVLAAVVASTPEGGEVRIGTAGGATVNGTPGAIVTISATTVAGADTLLYGSASRPGKIEPAKLFGAYLAARESGGTIAISRSGEALKAEIQLPLDSAKALPTPVKGDWLDRLFQHFEDWPA